MRVKECPVHMEARVNKVHRIRGKKLEQLGGGVAAEVEVLRVHVADNWTAASRPAKMVALDLQLPPLLSPCRRGARQDLPRRTLKAGAEVEPLGNPDR